MNRSRNASKVLKLKRQLEIAQKALFRSLYLSRESPLNDRHFRAMKRRLTDMEENLRALREGKIERVKMKPWMVERPTTESHLMYFCEA